MTRSPLCTINVTNIITKGLYETSYVWHWDLRPYSMKRTKGSSSVLHEVQEGIFVCTPWSTQSDLRLYSMKGTRGSMSVLHEVNTGSLSVLHETSVVHEAHEGSTSILNEGHEGIYHPTL